MRALQQTLVMKRFEILANGDQRSTKAFGEVANEDAPIVAQKFQDFAAAFFVEHG